jgi:phosphoadenosine phosphosulfate reductase
VLLSDHPFGGTVREAHGVTRTEALRSSALTSDEVGAFFVDREIEGMSTMIRGAVETHPLSVEEVAELNRRFEGAAPGEILQWAAEAFPEGRVALSSTFGVGGMVLIHLLAEKGIRLPVLFVDTLHHFPETLEHAERVAERYGLDLRTYRAAPSREAFEAEHGPRLWAVDVERFHQLTKVEPMREALEGFDAWITGRRRDQAPTRAELPIVERASRIKVNPIAAWSIDDVWTYVRVHEVPYHPLHDQGYASIGDEPLTTPVADGEHERAGRWRGGGRLECGLHGI